jgi:hypothetical protein
MLFQKDLLTVLFGRAAACDNRICEKSGVVDSNDAFSPLGGEILPGNPWMQHGGQQQWGIACLRRYT